MTATVHILVGAAITKKTSSPFLAFFLGILSHLILDLIPHKNLILSRKIAAYLICALDPILGFLILFVLKYPFNLTNLFGILGAISPDLFSVFQFTFRIKFFEPLYKFHHYLHWFENKKDLYDPTPSKINPWVGILPQIFISLISILWILNFDISL